MYWGTIAHLCCGERQRTLQLSGLEYSRNLRLLDASELVSTLLNAFLPSLIACRWLPSSVSSACTRLPCSALHSSACSTLISSKKSTNFRINGQPILWLSSSSPEQKTSNAVASCDCSNTSVSRAEHTLCPAFRMADALLVNASACFSRSWACISHA